MEGLNLGVVRFVNAAASFLPAIIIKAQNVPLPVCPFPQAQSNLYRMCKMSLQRITLLFRRPCIWFACFCNHMLRHPLLQSIWQLHMEAKPTSSTAVYILISKGNLLLYHIWHRLKNGKHPLFDNLAYNLMNSHSTRAYRNGKDSWKLKSVS